MEKKIYYIFIIASILGCSSNTKKIYYDTGELKFEYNEKNGKINGIFKGYYKTGELEFFANIKDDKLNGLKKHYYKNGKIKEELNFKNDLINGIIILPISRTV